MTFAVVRSVVRTLTTVAGALAVSVAAVVHLGAVTIARALA